MKDKDFVFSIKKWNKKMGGSKLKLLMFAN